jgi:uncharacterized phosphosugar-binding protein
MKTLARKYLETTIQLLSQIEDEEMDEIEKAAKLIADAIEQGHCLFAFGCTHSSLPIQDLVYRAGGMMLVNPLFGPGITALDIKPTTISSAMEQM